MPFADCAKPHAGGQVSTASTKTSGTSYRATWAENYASVLRRIYSGLSLIGKTIPLRAAAPRNEGGSLKTVAPQRSLRTRQREARSPSGDAAGIRSRPLELRGSDLATPQRAARSPNDDAAGVGSRPLCLAGVASDA